MTCSFFPLDRQPDELAVAIDRGDLGDDHFGQRDFIEHAPSAAADFPLIRHLAKQFFQLEFGVALKAEGAGDLPLADTPLAFAHELENLGFAGKLRGMFALGLLRHFYASSTADSFAFAFFFRAGFLALPFPARAAMSSRASSIVTLSGGLSLGSVALTLFHLT